MNIIGYAFDADTYCPNCTKMAWNEDALTLPPYSQRENPNTFDEHSIPLDLKDSEGNAIHPIFSIDEGPINDDGTEGQNYCRTCREVLE